MRISAKGEYAIQAMLDLALHRDRGLTPIQAIAARQAIPQRYLEQVLLALKRAGLLTSRRWVSNGAPAPSTARRTSPTVMSSGGRVR